MSTKTRKLIRDILALIAAAVAGMACTGCNAPCRTATKAAERICIGFPDKDSVIYSIETDLSLSPVLPPLSKD